MIDALAAITKLVSLDSGISALCGTRVAPRHKFSNSTASNGWKTPAKGIELQYDPGGTPDIDTEVQNVRIRAACYGEDDFQAARVHTALIHVTRETNRVVIATSNGLAFIYWLLLNGSPETLFNADIAMPFVQIYLTARVAEVPIA